MHSTEVDGQDSTKALAAALGRVPSGLFVLTVRHGRSETGMLASWVQQCSFEPPQLTAAVNTQRHWVSWLAIGSPFTVNVLGEGQKHLLAHFGKGFEANQAPFDGIQLVRLGDGAPALRDALAYLDCRVTALVPAGDHLLVVGRIESGQVLHEGRPTVHVRKSGMHY
jgi:flavin reductase (DIM6/NTAB) family NADH-FMN oxidoreductase RutF